MSLKPPLKALVNGVRIARVMTTSSAFLEVLWWLACGRRRGGRSYIEESPDEPGVRCLRMELSLSPAMMN